MNFVAGMFLTLMPEEESFWLLVAVMNEEPCRMRGLFGEGMRETHLVLHVAERLIQLYLPKVYKQLDKEHIHVTMFATQWLLTQFTSSFRFDLVLRVWDAFLGEGWKVSYRIMLALLKLHESILLQSSFEDILALFRELPSRVDGSTVIETAMQLPLRRQSIHKFEMEWYQAQQQQAATAAATAVAQTTATVTSSNNKKKGGTSSSSKTTTTKTSTTTTTPRNKATSSTFSGKKATFTTGTSPKTKNTPFSSPRKATPTLSSSTATRGSRSTSPRKTKSSSTGGGSATTTTTTTKPAVAVKKKGTTTTTTKSKSSPNIPKSVRRRD